MQSVLKIPIKFETGKVRTLSLVDPKSDLTQNEVLNFSNYATQNLIFRYGGEYGLQQEGDAYIYNTNEIPLT